MAPAKTLSDVRDIVDKQLAKAAQPQQDGARLDQLRRDAPTAGVLLGRNWSGRPRGGPLPAGLFYGVRSTGSEAKKDVLDI